MFIVFIFFNPTNFPKPQNVDRHMLQRKAKIVTFVYIKPFQTFQRKSGNEQSIINKVHNLSNLITMLFQLKRRIY